jgi:hypothetical protein
MHGIIAKHELVRVFDRRSQHEPRSGLGLQDQRLAGLFEDCQLAFATDLAIHPQLALVDGQLGHVVSDRGIVDPALLGLHVYGQIVE